MAPCTYVNGDGRVSLTTDQQKIGWDEIGWCESLPEWKLWVGGWVRLETDFSFMAKSITRADELESRSSISPSLRLCKSATLGRSILNELKDCFTSGWTCFWLHYEFLVHDFISLRNISDLHGWIWVEWKHLKGIEWETGSGNLISGDDWTDIWRKGTV